MPCLFRFGSKARKVDSGVIIALKLYIKVYVTLIQAKFLATSNVFDYGIVAACLL